MFVVDSFRAVDGKTIYYRSWQAEKPSLNILLAHGMTEHSERYAHFGQFLAERGISVYALDQRAHGQTAVNDDTVGHLRKNIDWDLMILDLVELEKIIYSDNQAPTLLMGHSMGSFLARCTIQRYPNLFQGLILSGTGDSMGLIGKIALKLIKFWCTVCGEEKVAIKTQNLVLSLFNLTVKAPRTKFDWMTRDTGVIATYLQDDLCGFMCTNGFYHELLSGITLANDTQKMSGLNKKMPIYLFSGDKDPVGALGKGVKKAAEQFAQVGMTNVTYKLYQDARHEMLNEVNQLEVYADLYHWLLEQFSCNKNEE